jgi:hypothetical protein
MATVRVLLIVGAVGGLTAWVVAQGTAVPAATPSSARAATGTILAVTKQPAPPRPGDPGFDVEINRLRAEVGGMPSPMGSGRNPFRFGPTERSARAAVPPHHGAAPAQVAATATGGIAPDRPLMQLLGVADDGTGTARVRTAVIATARQLYLVREGEQIALRFQVVRIGEDAVELRDLVSDETFPLALR